MKKTAILLLLLSFVISAGSAEENAAPDKPAEKPNFAFQVNTGFPFVANPEILFPIARTLWIGAGIQFAYPLDDYNRIGITLKLVYGILPDKFAFYIQPSITVTEPADTTFGVFQALEIGVYYRNFCIGLNLNEKLIQESFILPGIKIGYALFFRGLKLVRPEVKQSKRNEPEPEPEPEPVKKAYSTAFVVSAGYPFVAGIGYLWKFRWIEFGPALSLYSGDWNLWYGLRLNFPLFKHFSVNSEIDFLSTDKFVLSFGIGIYNVSLLASFYRDFDQPLYEDTEYSVGGKLSWEF